MVLHFKESLLVDEDTILLFYDVLWTKWGGFPLLRLCRRGQGPA